MHESGHGTKRHTLARASQLRGDLEAEGPRLARRDVVVAVGRGLALVEEARWSPVRAVDERQLA